MSQATAVKSDEAQIRELIQRWAEAPHTKDIDTIMACYAPDVVAFDAISKFQFKGKEAYREHWQACLDMMPGGVRFEVHELDIAKSGHLAFCRFLGYCGGTMPDGSEQYGWLRCTICCRKLDGHWLIVHEHHSVPFDPESGKVLSEREP
ncbi:MAG: SgcJ/EcaC family oxidoreductase [Ectothiorhodospiraceae bacterium]|nr:SgcJ/EcaC family oxidoreductase [Ectothiorhodospiraceae bacterium]